MAQTATNPKIEELRGKLKADPKSRLFYQLAEELRRAGQAGESEQVLRNGLSVYPTYLAAWVSLGRTCREQKNEAGAIEALNRALQLDPGNVVAARLLGDAYLAHGEKVEAIKKYKLVHALLPADEELQAIIARLDRELNPITVAVAEPEVTVGEADPAPRAGTMDAPETPAAAPEGLPAADTALTHPAEEPLPASVFSLPEPEEESPFDKTSPPFAVDSESRSADTGDDEAMFASHDESPFEEPVAGFSTTSAEIEQVRGFSIEESPVEAGPMSGAQEAYGAPEMAGPAETRIARLESWLSRVSRRDGGDPHV